MVQEHVPSKVVVMLLNDPRSDRVSSDKLFAAGFRPEYTAKGAIKGIVDLHRRDAVNDEDRWCSCNWMDAAVLS